MKRSIVAARGEEDREFQRYKRGREINYIGCISFVAYICAFAFYLWVRITKTLDLGGFVW